MDDRTDEQLIEDYGVGDNQALEILIGRYLRPIYNFIARSIGDRDASEDVVQEVFLKAYRHIGSFRTDGKFKPWIFRIARNASIDHLRKKKEIHIADLTGPGAGDFDAALDSVIDPSPPPGELFDQAAVAASLRDALDRLPLLYKQAVLMHYMEGLTFSEISEITGEPLNTAKSRCTRALAMIRKSMVDRAGQP